MAKKEKDNSKQAAAPEAEAPDTDKQAAPQEEAPDLAPKVQELQEQLEKEHDLTLRLAAEYDNFRKRTQKEKDASYANGKADTVVKFLPVYDNLERALSQDTADAAFKKGVEMTMAELVKILDGLGITAYGEPGDKFDPNLHNAVMHTEDESLGENVISQVFQKGFRAGEKVIRFSMVQVAN